MICPVCVPGACACCVLRAWVYLAFITRRRKIARRFTAYSLRFQKKTHARKQCCWVRRVQRGREKRKATLLAAGVYQTKCTKQENTHTLTLTHTRNKDGKHTHAPIVELFLHSGAGLLVGQMRAPREPFHALLLRRRAAAAAAAAEQTVVLLRGRSIRARSPVHRRRRTCSLPLRHLEEDERERVRGR